MTVTPARQPAAGGPGVWPLSIQAYRTLGELGLLPKNTELLYGQVFQKMSKSPLHTGLVLRLLRLLQAQLPTGCHLRPEQPLTCADSEPEPDVAVVRGREEEFWQEHPHTAELVVEVCVSSHDYDRTKLRAYALAGVKEVWFVLAPEARIEVYRQPAGGEFSERSRYSAGESFTSQMLPGFRVNLAEVFGK
jgi:Uma2 family endonuclease